MVGIPRKAPDGMGVTEHRITLGNYERDQFKQIVNAKETQLYLQPFQYVLPVALVGAGAYAGLAWFMEWWPFGAKETSSGFGFSDVAMYGVYSDEEKANEKEAAELAALDKAHQRAIKWLEDNPSPSGLTGFVTQKGISGIVDNYPAARQKIIEKWAIWRIHAAERAAEIESQSEYV